MSKNNNKKKKLKDIDICFSYNANGIDQAKAIFDSYLYLIGIDNIDYINILSYELFPLFWNILNEMGWKTTLPLLKSKNSIGYEIK